MEQGNMKEVRLPLTTREYGLLEEHAKRAGYSSLPDYLKVVAVCQEFPNAKGLELLSEIHKGLKEITDRLEGILSIKKDPGVLKQAINEDAIPVTAKYLLRRLGIRTYD